MSLRKVIEASEARNRLDCRQFEYENAGKFVYKQAVQRRIELRETKTTLELASGAICWLIATNTSAKLLSNHEAFLKTL
jgi:hypothetical protein